MNGEKSFMSDRVYVNLVNSVITIVNSRINRVKELYRGLQGAHIPWIVHLEAKEIEV